MKNDAVVTIERMAFGGAGFGHLDGKACFVPFAAPGDTVRIGIKVEKRSYLEGELLEILSPSAQRATPVCPVFGKCGGCNWQHITYDAQVAAKGEVFAELLWRAGRVERERIMPVLPSPEPFGYRSRVQLKLRSVAGEMQMGFYRAGSHFVVNIPDMCPIAHPHVNRIIGRLRPVVSALPETDKVPQIDVAVGDNGQSELVFHYIGTRKEEFSGFLRQGHKGLEVDRIFLQSGRKNTLEQVSGDPCRRLTYVVPGFRPEHPAARLAFCSGGFSQVNYRQNAAIIDMVREWAGLTGRERVLDIYCGNGNFSIPLAPYASQVVGVEDYEPSIEVARLNCAANGIENVRFKCDDAVSAIGVLAAAGERFDLVLLDPPRSGAAGVVKEIPSLRPESIIYVSCDPSTLARDIGILKKFNYDVIKSRPVDMFPQTYHTESVTLLKPAS